MFKIKTIKSAGLLLVTFTALLFINIKIVSAQEKPTLNRAILLENKIELPSNNVNAKGNYSPGSESNSPTRAI